MAPREQEAVPEVARTVVDTRLAEDDRPHWTFGTGLGVLSSPGGLRPQPLLQLQLGYAFSPSLAAEVQLASSVFPAHVDGRYGSSAEVGAAFLRAQASWTPLALGGFRAGLLAGTGALLFWASGNATRPGLEGTVEAAIAWLLSAGLNASLRVSEAIRVQLIGAVGLCVPQLGVELVDEARATFGRPVIDAVLRLEFQ